MNNIPTCQNCSAPLQGKFCHECGQKKIEDRERTFTHFIYQFFGAAFFLENNFLKNLWYLLIRPGVMAQEYVSGRRKRYMPPLSLFLLINLFYFLFVNLTDLNLSLAEQVHQPQHFSFAKKMVDGRLADRQVSFDVYQEEYNAMSTSLSKTLIILHVPILALLLMGIFWRKHMYYSDHLIFSLYLIAFVLLISMLVFNLLLALIRLSILPANRLFTIYGIIELILIGTYFYFAILRFYKPRWYWTLAAMPVVFTAFLATHLIYRSLLFLIVFWST